MKHHLTKTMGAIALTAGLVLGGGGIAFAYFTSGGSGTGQATVGSTGRTDFAVTSSWSDTNLFPGSDAVPFTLTVQNTGSGDEHAGVVDITVASQTETGDVFDHGAAVSGCLASWFTVTPQVTVGSTLSAGAYDRDIEGADISMTETGTSQDACQGHAVDMTFTVDTGI
jgi:hypothetical protein